MLAILRRKLGLGTSAQTPTPTPGQNPDPSALENPVSANPGDGMTENLPRDLNVEDLGFNWPTDIAGTCNDLFSTLNLTFVIGNFSQSSIPLWLQDSDLSFPVNGSDGIFLKVIDGSRGDIGAEGW
jgi:hypothetical protein